MLPRGNPPCIPAKSLLLGSQVMLELGGCSILLMGRNSLFWRTFFTSPEYFQPINGLELDTEKCPAQGTQHEGMILQPHSRIEVLCMPLTDSCTMITGDGDHR